MNEKINTFTLNNQVKIPCIGYGTWKLPDGDSVIKSVKSAIDCGYRLIDTASAYGNETGVGKAINESQIDRNKLFITGKLWNSERGYDKTISAFKNTLNKLSLEYLDMYLIHWPASPILYENWKDINSDTWRAFESLYEEGLIKAIGVCNFKIHHLEPLMKNANILPMVNQIEYHPGQPQDETVKFCKQNDIQIEAWSPLGSGKMMKKEPIKELAEKLNVTVAQLCIRWCLQNNIIPLPRSKTAERIKENLDIFNFTLSDEDMYTLNTLPYCGGSGLDPDEVTIFG